MVSTKSPSFSQWLLHCLQDQKCPKALPQDRALCSISSLGPHMSESTFCHLGRHPTLHHCSFSAPHGQQQVYQQLLLGPFQNTPQTSPLCAAPAHLQCRHQLSTAAVQPATLCPNPQGPVTICHAAVSARQEHRLPCPARLRERRHLRRGGLLEGLLCSREH